MATWRHVEAPIITMMAPASGGQSTTMTRGDPPDTKPWASPRAIWFVCLFNRSSHCKRPDRGGALRLLATGKYPADPARSQKIFLITYARA